MGRMQAWLMEHAPGAPLMSRDNLDSMKVDNVATGQLPGLQALGITPSALKPIAEDYLRFLRADYGLQGMRKRACGA
jgi:NADH dehydrogenase